MKDEWAYLQKNQDLLAMKNIATETQKSTNRFNMEEKNWKVSLKTLF